MKIRAFTLTELLVTLAILLILASLIASGLIAGKDRAKVTADISNMHQLGLAGSIYSQSHDDMPPLNVRQVWEAGLLLSQTICKSPMDLRERGITHDFVSEFRGIFPLDPVLPLVPTTYIGPRDGGWPVEMYQRRIAPARNPGWLVNLVRTKTDSTKSYKSATGIYHRLLLDASVQARTMGTSSLFLEGEFYSKAISFGSFFCDQDSAYFMENQ